LQIQTLEVEAKNQESTIKKQEKRRQRRRQKFGRGRQWRTAAVGVKATVEGNGCDEGNSVVDDDNNTGGKEIWLRQWLW
jgi:hypothetical protein